MSLEQDYIKNAKRFGARVGDFVTIIQKYDSETAGWRNTWDSGMNQYVGQTGKIIKDYGTSGLKVDFDDNADFLYCFPWFCMKIIR